MRSLNKQQRWVEQNRDKVRANQTRYTSANPEMRLLTSARRRARDFGLPFSITKQDIVIPEICPVLGIRLTQGVRPGRRSGPQPSSMSIDKIVPALGYVPGNIQVISHLANSMKSSATPEQMVAFAKWALKEHGE